MGRIVLLNGAPRAGKSTIAQALKALDPPSWVIHGNDVMIAATDPDLYPGQGLRPGGDRPDLEPFVFTSLERCFAQVSNLAQQGFNVACDITAHENYLTRARPWLAAMGVLSHQKVLTVGVFCPLNEIMRRRSLNPDIYETSLTNDPSSPIQLWQSTIHANWRYDVEIDTSVASPSEAALVIHQSLECLPSPTALERAFASSDEF